jgi:group I intron endonuclease
MKTGIIYTLSHPITKKVVYIGKTIHTLQNRLYGHIGDSKRHNRKICKWICKLTSEQLIPLIEELDSSSEEDLARLEIFYIELFKSWGFDLKNHTIGGEGVIGFNHSKKSKLLMSKQRAGERNFFYNKKHTQETKDKISLANKGRKNSEDFCKKRSDYMKANPVSHETYQKIAEINKIKIGQYDLDMNLIKIHDSAADACRDLPGFSTGHISSCCKGKRKTHKGFVWKYY